MMRPAPRMSSRWLGAILLSLAWASTGQVAVAAAVPVATLAASPLANLARPAYHPIDPKLADQTVVLSGHDLTIEQVVQVARYGAKVALSPEARQRSADAYGLLLEAAAENVPVYWFNRGSGAGRQTVIFSGDALTPENKAKLEKRQLGIFRRGARAGMGPEVSDEEIVRAMLVVRANTMTYEAASPPLMQQLLSLLNNRVTPVVQSRGTVGEGDLGPLTNVAGVMVGSGEAYYRGERMSAAEALERAGLKPLQPFAADDSALESSNSYATGQAALLVNDAREVLSWADLIYAVDLNAMNSSVTPLAAPVQANRPFKWLNWHAARMLDMLKGSYLFEEDPNRIIQDPESLRASSIRQGSAWQAWGQMRDDLLLQINSSDHNPAVRVGAAPTDSWELSTPQLRQFYVKGGPLSHGQHGFILSDANWDPYPLANEIEAFSIAIANMDAAIAQRINRFTNIFFTGISPNDYQPGEPGRFGSAQGSGLAAASMLQEVQGLAVPVAPEGNALIQTVEDLQSQTRLKVGRARLAVADTLELLAEDLLSGCYWLDMRTAQSGGRSFGPVTTAVWQAFRATLRFEEGSDQDSRPIHELAATFLRTHAVASFYAGNGNEPASEKRSTR
jgi:histidine ammonia-lyase